MYRQSPGVKLNGGRSIISKTINPRERPHNDKHQKNSSLKSLSKAKIVKQKRIGGKNFS